MTSDAKIGLLLGLVFIFIIAFIINGLPSLGQANNPNQLTTNMVNSQNGNSMALGSDERQLQRRIIRPAQTASAQNSSAQTPDSSLRPASANITRSQQQNDQVRFTLPLTDDSQIQQASRQAVREQHSQPAQTQQNTQQTYTVKSGDNLASIAKQVYGQVLGNKRENIDRIFQANSDSLSSPDRIVVGQELIIPPLDDEHFEAVSSVGRRHDTSAQAARPAPAQPRTYTVRSGDSLWTIAQRQLGDGNRYKEIQDLNERMLANPSTIKPGDTILIPAN